MTRTIKLKTFLPYTQDKVWNALTDSNMLGSWFMQNDIKPELGYHFTFRMKPQKGWDGITHCEIIALEPKNIWLIPIVEKLPEKKLLLAQEYTLVQQTILQKEFLLNSILY